MTWGEFKQALLDAGILDTDRIDFIDVNGLHEEELEIDREPGGTFSVIN